MSEPVGYGEVPSGLVSVEHENGRWRVTVRHSETDVDYLWVGLDEAIEVSFLLTAAVKPFFEGKPGSSGTAWASLPPIRGVDLDAPR